MPGLPSQCAGDVVCGAELLHRHGWQSCAECTLQPLSECRKFNSFIGKVFGFVFRSDRSGCIARIREVGADAFAGEMRRAGSYNRPVKK